MRQRTVRQAVLLMVLAGAATMNVGCEKKLRAERDALYAQNQELEQELKSAREAMEAAEAERASLTAQLADMQSQPAPTTNATTTAAANPFGGISGVSVSQDAEKVTVSVAGDILFDSGRATLKSSAKQTLQQVANVLNAQYPGSIVRVEGHTDADPIRKSRDKWRDNYHLSEARAVSVRDYLVSQGVTRSRMMIIGHGPDQPVASNKTRTGKAQNRRVEIIVVK